MRLIATRDITIERNLQDLSVMLKDVSLHEPSVSNDLHPLVKGTRTAFLYSLPGVLLVVFIYSLVHVTIRLLASDNLGEDDPFENLLIQSLAPGYSANQGPLYDWVLWLLQQVVGSGIHAFLLLKYGLLIAMAGFLFLIAQRVTGSALWAFMAVDAMALVYQIFWRFHEGFTHRIGAMTLAVMTFWALMRVIDRSRHRDYALFAIFVGLGLLTEHTYLVFLLALMLAAWSHQLIRRRVFAAPMMMFLPLSALIVLPYAVWIFADAARVTAFVAALFPFGERSFAEMWAGINQALTFPILLMSPYLFILPMVFPGMLKLVWKPVPRPFKVNAEADISRLILYVITIEIIMLVLFGIFSSKQSSYSVHSLLPMFVIAIVWLTNKARESAPSSRQIRIFVLVMISLTVLAFVGRAANMFVLDPVCKKCRWGVPYAGLAKEIKSRGFDTGRLVTNDVELGGNMRRFFPNAYIEVPGWVPSKQTTPSQATTMTVVVWSARGGSEAVPSELMPYLADAAPVQLQVPWQHLWRPEGYRSSTWVVAIQR